MNFFNMEYFHFTLGFNSMALLPNRDYSPDLESGLLKATVMWTKTERILERTLISGNEINSSLTVFSRIIKRHKRIIWIKKF